MSKYIAVDLGASSGRVVLGELNGDKIVLDEIHRFENGPTEENGSLRWDFTKLFSSIKTGIKKAIRKADGEVEAIGVDGWGVDFGLLDAKGKLLENPYHYRDSRTDGMMEKAFELMPKESIYNATGIQFMQLNTIYQLLSMRLACSEISQKVDRILFIADLVAYYLCGAEFAEYTLASTSQLMDMKTGEWSKEIFDKLSLTLGMMPKVVAPGTVVGQLKDDVAEEFGCGKIPIVAVGAHDTASAVAAVPADEKTSWAYLSSGTWNLLGVEIPETIINDKTFEYQFTNEGGVAGTIRLLKNIMGLWLVQECRRVWDQQNDNLSFSDLTDMAEQAHPFGGFVNPSDSRFFSPCDMPAKINNQAP